jgi:hypothetical protein
MFIVVIYIPTESVTSPYYEWESMTNARHKNSKLSTSLESKTTGHTCNNTILPWRAPLRCVTSLLGAVHQPQFHYSMSSVAASSSLLIKLWHSSTSSDGHLQFLPCLPLSLLQLSGQRWGSPSLPNLPVFQPFEKIILVVCCREFTRLWRLSYNSEQEEKL